jgi:calcium/calmodulin-dependent protein kinase (CaM kinase) II
MRDPVAAELLQLNQKLLDCIAQGDWATYEELCDPSLSAFEPESRGHLVEGLGFHRFYFDLGGAKGQHNTTMSTPHVRVMGDVAVVACVRLNQRQDEQGRPVTMGFEETRVWQRRDGRWRHVHFHRSALPG